MCSVCGITDFENMGGTDIAELSRMSGKMMWENTERSSIYITANAGLCCNRETGGGLSGIQPMTVVFGRRIYTIIYSGRLRNADFLRNELKKSGAVFVTESDAEVIVYSYIVYGKHCPCKLQGSFVFCIYDEWGERLFVARSKTGDKRLFYTFRCSAMLFATERAALTDKGDLADEADGVYEIRRGYCGYFSARGLYMEKY